MHRSIVDAIGLDALLGMSAWIVLACGRVPLGNAGFAAIGGAATLLLEVRYRVPVSIAIVAAIACSALIGFALGAVLARAERVPFAVATLAFGIVAGGIAVPGRVTAEAASSATIQILAVLALTFFLMWRFMRSRDGRAFAAVAQDERAAATSGMAPPHLRLIAVAASAAIAGSAGALIAAAHGAYDDAWFGLAQNAGALACAVVGGAGAIAGPAIGALALAGIPLLAPPLASHAALVDAALLLCFATLLPGGLASLAAPLFRRRPEGAGPP